MTCLIFVTHISTPAARVNWMNKTVPDALEKASHIIAISKATAGDLHELMGVPREKISVVYQGLDVAFRQGMGKLKSDPLTALGFNDAAVFSVCFLPLSHAKISTVYSTPTCNFLRVYETVTPLVLVGGYGWRSEATRTRVSALSSEGVRYLSYVPESNAPQRCWASHGCCLSVSL